MPPRASATWVLEYWPARWPSVTSLVTAFEVGLVSAASGRQLVRGAAAHRHARWPSGVATSSAELVGGPPIKHRDAGTPRLARGAAEVLGELDMTAWTSVLGLDECPVIPAAPTAILEGCKTTVSPTAFDFISTAAQIGDVRLFMRKLHQTCCHADRRPNGLRREIRGRDQRGPR